MNIRSNASAKTLLKYFMEKCEGLGKKYYPKVPWDEKNLEQLREYYAPLFIVELMDFYFKKYYLWSVQDFCNKIQTLAEGAEQDRLAQEAFKEQVRRTRERMREAGLYES